MSGLTDGVAPAGSDGEPLPDAVGVGWPVVVGLLDWVDAVRLAPGGEAWSVVVGLLGWVAALMFAAAVVEIDCAGAHGAPAVVKPAAAAATGPPVGITGVPNNG
jgi:hypothetical protein